MEQKTSGKMNRRYTQMHADGAGVERGFGVMSSQGLDIDTFLGPGNQNSHTLLASP